MFKTKEKALKTTYAPIYPGDAGENVEVSGATQNARREAAKHGLWSLVVLSLLMGFASISTDLYLPAMPAMGSDLSASPGMIEWTVSGYLIGFSIGQLFWGPISDRYGRRIPVAIGLLLFVLGAAGCALSANIWAMIGWRIVQALGACASVVLSRAMVRDLYEGSKAAQMMSTLITIMAVTPLIGPLMGGQILLFLGWRWIFWSMFAVGFLTLAALFTIPETLARKNRNHEPMGKLYLRYWKLLQNRTILTYAGVGGFFYGGAYAYIAGSPFAFISYHHLPPQYYGYLFALGIIGIMASNTINSRIISKIGGKRLILWGSLGTALTGLFLVVAGLADMGGLSGLVVPLALFMSMNGFIVANAMAGALQDFPRNAGAVSALLGAFQYGSGILGTGLVGLFADGTPWPMCAVIAIAGIGCLVCAKLIPQSSRGISA